ncbi:MAG: hypothetical protein R2759_00115 [Bacteroidales bacterium]
MNERIIEVIFLTLLKSTEVNDKNLDVIKSFFRERKVKIIARDMVKVGNNEDMDSFEDKFDLLLAHFERFGKLGTIEIEQILQDEELLPAQADNENDNGILVHGVSGKLIKTMTKNQRMVNA